MRVLIVDDDTELCALLQEFLERETFRVTLEHNGVRGLDLAAAGGFDLVVLDLMLPGLDGFALLKRLRARSRVPVLMLTARGEDEDRIIGLELGADDYLAKPFNPRELLARIRAILRRAGAGSGTRSEPVATEIGSIVVDAGRREVRCAGNVVPLTTREFDLLAYLVANRGLAMSRRQLLDGVWGEGWYGDERTVDVHVRQLRKKLGDELPLTTVWGVGYRLG